MTYVDKYWKHKRIVIESLEHQIDFLSAITITENVRSNPLLQTDLMNNILSVLNVIKEIQNCNPNVNYYLLSDVIEKNKEAILTALDSNINSLEKSSKLVSNSAPVLELQLLNGKKDKIISAKCELFSPEAKQDEL